MGKVGLDDYLVAHGPEALRKLLEAAEPATPTRFNLTDVGNGQRLAARHGRNLRYDHTAGRWYAWDGKRWSPDARGQVETWAKDTARSIYEEAAQEPDPDRRALLAKHAARTEARRSIEAMIAMCASESGIPILAEDLDADPWLFNVQDGTIDLRTGELRPHRREDLISKIAPVNYDPAATCSRWEQFTSEVFSGRENLITFVRRGVGASLAGAQRDHVLLLLYGKGANGKSTFIETLLAFFGDYGHRASTSTFLEQRNEGIRTDIADLRGARFVSAVETKQGRRLDEALVKMLTGGDTVRARHLYQEAFSFKPQFTCWLATNHKPEIREQTLAIWRRIRLVPFDLSIPSEQQDPELATKLREELPGILAWAVRGCLEWQRVGLGEPEEVEQATREYREEQDVLADFLGACCARGPQVGAGDLYARYREWCIEQGDQPFPQRSLGRMLGERGFRRQRGTGGRIYYLDLSLKSEGSEGSEGSESISGKFSRVSTIGKFPEKGSLGSLGSLADQSARGARVPPTTTEAAEVEVVL